MTKELDLEKLEAVAKAAASFKPTKDDLALPNYMKRASVAHRVFADLCPPETALALIERIRELEKDAARLNWLQEHKDGVSTCTHTERLPRTDGTNNRDQHSVFDGWVVQSRWTKEECSTIREAIDTAIKEQTHD
jgi:hypothetical protein